MPNPTYQISLPGATPFDDASRLIHQEELDGLSTFRNCVIVAAEKRNQLTFERVGVLNTPDECRIVKLDAQAPAGAKKVWTGKMLLSNQAASVDFYRLAPAGDPEP